MTTINIQSSFLSEEPKLQNLMQEGLYLIFVSGISCDTWRAYSYQGGKLLKQSSIPCYEKDTLNQLINQHSGKVYGFNVGYFMFPRKWKTLKDSYQLSGVSEIINVELSEEK